jgi:carbonic anhydrase
MPHTVCRSLDRIPNCTAGRTPGGLGGDVDSAANTSGWCGSARLNCALALASALCAATPTWAAGDHAAPDAAAKPAAKAVAAAAVDPMDTLREKLAAKLGAVKAPESVSPYVVRVVSKSGDAAHGDAISEPKAGGHGPAAKAAKLRATPAAVLPAGHASHWSYAGAGGPEQWGGMKAEFSTCSNGSRQSPIDIRSGVRVDLEPIQFDYRPSAFRVVDTGHTVQVNVGGGNSIEVQGRRYDLIQFHFHRPSEERVDGRQFDMVAHLVHQDPEGRLAVVAVLLDRGSAHPLVQTIWNNLPLEQNVEVATKASLDMNHLLPADRRYFTYMGSLTTPPCSEGVLWMVMQQPVPIATEQINVFSRLYPMNARPIQSASGRLIKQSN